MLCMLYLQSSSHVQGLHLSHVCCCQVLDPGGSRKSPQLALFEELVVRAYLAVSSFLH